MGLTGFISTWFYWAECFSGQTLKDHISTVPQHLRVCCYITRRKRGVTFVGRLQPIYSFKYKNPTPHHDGCGFFLLNALGTLLKHETVIKDNAATITMEVVISKHVWLTYKQKVGVLRDVCIYGYSIKKKNQQNHLFALNTKCLGTLQMILVFYFSLVSLFRKHWIRLKWELACIGLKSTCDIYQICFDVLLHSVKLHVYVAYILINRMWK